MDSSTINHANSGDTNPRGQPRSWLLELYIRSPPSQREEKAQLLNFCRLRRQTALWYTLDEDQRTEREVRNCPPKRVRSRRLARGLEARPTRAKRQRSRRSGQCAGRARRALS